MAQQASITNRGKKRLRYYCGQWFLVFLVLSLSVAFRVSGAMAVRGFTCLRSYRGHRQKVAMQWKELMTRPIIKKSHFTERKTL